MRIRHPEPFTIYSLAARVAALFLRSRVRGQTEAQALASPARNDARRKTAARTGGSCDRNRGFAGKTTGALAKLLRARIHFENGDSAGAAAMLDSPVFAEKTKVADYALWLRGKALQNNGNHAEAIKVLTTLIDTYPASLRRTDAELLRASSAIAGGSAAEVPRMAERAELAKQLRQFAAHGKSFRCERATVRLPLPSTAKRTFFGAGFGSRKRSRGEAYGRRSGTRAGRRRRSWVRVSIAFTRRRTGPTPRPRRPNSLRGIRSR